MSLILSIDGGGALGAGPLRLLASLEADGINIHDDIHDDILTGTSVGGLLVLCRAIGMSWQETETVFTKWVPAIFAPSPWWWSADPTRPKYQDDGIIAATHALFGDKRAKDAERPFFVTSFDFQQGRPKIWDNTDDETLVNIALRTSAAPTYFQPRESRWADGALASNNPSMIGVAGAMGKLEKSLPNLSVLSLATGGSFWTDPQIGRRTTPLGWAQPVITATLDGGEEVPDYQCAMILGKRYLRLDPGCTHDFPMDKLSMLDEFRGLWSALYLKRKAEILSLVQTGSVP